MEKRRKNRIILSHRYRDSRFRRKKTGSSRTYTGGELDLRGWNVYYVHVVNKNREKALAYIKTRLYILQ